MGDRALFSKNGGKSIFTVFLLNTDRSKLWADIRRIEQMVKVKIKNGRNKTSVAPKKTPKKVVKKSVKKTKK